jgi:anti-anti-sigma factor
MLEFTFADLAGLPTCRLAGRLDSLTATDAQRALDGLVEAGQRTIILDLEQLHYVSSAGLRVFLMQQKLLRQVGGRLIIYRPVPAVLQVFQLSGFLRLFDVVSSPEELQAQGAPQGAAATSRSQEAEGIAFTIIERPATPARFLTYGSQDKLSRSLYTRQDVAAVPGDGPLLGLGLGAFGDNYDEYKNFFGEALIVNHSLFYHPAIPRAGVDFILNPAVSAEVDYKFLHGFGFQGAYTAVCSFESQVGLIDLNALLAALGKVYPAQALGFALLAESKGLWGMNLKKPPIRENQPTGGRDIFDPELFQDWMNFPVEPADVGHIIVGAGLAVAARAQAPERLGPWLPADRDFHLHAGVFAKGPLGKQPEQFEDELARVIGEMEVHKVQHLLGRSQVSGGLLGLMALEV